MATAQDPTICPNCEATGGELASPCTNAVCNKKGYHFIPEENYRRSLKKTGRAASRHDPELGRLIERYLLVEKLGEGGMGAVYLALQLPLKREVALKMIAGLRLDDDAKQRFEREAKSISMLYHPNIVSLLDYGIDSETGVPFMALEYVKGGRELSVLMEEKRKRGEKWQHEELINIFSQILNGLAMAHKGGLIHRDIKPQNIMLVKVVGNPHFVNILDFGLVKALEDVPGLETLTAKGAVLGTPQYMAPEQVASKGEVDYRCDLYATGAIFFEMITGRPCCSGKSTKEIFFEKLDPDYSPVKTIPPGSVPPDIEAFINRAMSRDPAARFPSGAAMKRALVEVLGGNVEDVLSEDEEFSTAPTVAADSLEQAGHDTYQAKILTKDAGSVKTTACRIEKTKKAVSRWALPAIALAAALVIAVLFGPWSPFRHEPDEKEPAGSRVAQAPHEADSLETVPQEAITKSPQPLIDEAFENLPIKEGPSKTESNKPLKSALPDVPSGEDINREMQKFETIIKECAGSEKGTLNIKVTFQGKSGKAIGLSMGGNMDIPSVRACIGKKFFALKVPPFSKPLYVATLNFSNMEKAGDAGKAGEAAGSLPAKPSKEILDAELVKLRKKIEKCAEGHEGYVEGTITFAGKTGYPYGYSKKGSLNKKDIAQCITKAVNQARVPPFSDENFILTFKVKIEKGALPEKPSKEAIDEEFKTLNYRIKKCTQNVEGDLRAVITLEGETGKPASIMREGSLMKSEAKACIVKALGKVQVPPFSETLHTVVFEFSTQDQ